MESKEFLKYRNVWMGIAMLWIIWFHSSLVSPFVPLEQLRLAGYGGVDIFLFASGIGCFYSLSRDPDPFNFLKRRIARLFPAYICFISVWLLAMIVAGSVPVWAALGNILAVQNFTCLGYDFNWYISAIFLLYLLSPLFKSMAEQIKGTFGHLAVVGLLILFSVAYHNSNNLIITITRIPIFYIGMVFGKLCLHDGALHRRIVVGALGSTVIGTGILVLCNRYLSAYLWSHGLSWYPFILITPGVCILISQAFGCVEKYRAASPVIRLLAWIGQYSFELYLVHVMVFYVKSYLLNSRGLFVGSPFVWPVTIAAIVIGSLALRFCANTLTKMLHSLKMRKAGV